MCEVDLVEVIGCVGSPNGGGEGGLNNTRISHHLQCILQWGPTLAIRGRTRNEMMCGDGSEVQSWNRIL